MHKIKLILYYLFVQKLPHSRLWVGFNGIRRWYIAKILRVMPNDKNSKFENGIYISDARNLQIGKYVRINEDVFFQGKITIGDFVMIAPNTSFYTTTHQHGDTTSPMVTQGETVPQEIIVEDDVWVGRNVVILPGITIGKGAIIGANTVVTKNVEPYAIVGGVPARLIRKRI